MRLSATVPFAAAAAAIVIPDLGNPSSWADFVPSQDDVRDSVGGFVSHVKGNLDSLAAGIEDVITSAGDSLSHTLDSAFQDEASLFGGHHGGHHRKGENQTIYELIKESDYTSKFAAIVDEHESIVKLLNSTKANYTLFVPINSAFEHIPDHPDHKPSKEFVEALLKYHVGVGLYPAGRILATHTLPTALEESALGDEAQRLRVRVGLTGVRVNFYDKVVGADFFAKNGVIHAVRNILVPPPHVGRLLSLFPSKFSTFLLALEKTKFADFVHSIPVGGGATVFAPSNTAFERLGPGANAFLFNSEKGLKYLKALLKYHMAINETLYSDALYIDKKHKSSPVDVFAADDDVEADGLRHYHVDLPSLLEEKNIAVDITRWGGFIDIKVNGYVHVAIQDGVARNGVVHVVDQVLLPHRSPGKDEAIMGEVDVEELKQILEPFIEKADESANEEWTDL
jgi:uncharacterized surface protein with fasciclin (FAS1) repeats